MRRALVIEDLKPAYQQGGGVIYGLSATPDKPEDVTVSLNDGSVVVVQNGVVSVKLPGGQVVSQPIKTSGLGDGKTVGSSMMAVGGAVAVIIPVGTVVGAVLAAAGALISAFSNGKAARKAAEQAGQYDASNVALQSQNAQLDSKIIELQNAIIKAKKDLGLAGGGLGWCLINCAKTKAETQLKTAKQLFDELNTAQNSRIDTLQRLTDEVQKMFDKKKLNTYLYIGAGVVVAGALGYLLLKKRN